MRKTIGTCLLVVALLLVIWSLAKGSEYDIQASWIPNIETDLAGYKLYLNDQVIADITAPTTQWSGTVDLAYELNVFELTAYDQAGNESGRSDSYGIDPAPAKPIGFTITITITPQ